MDIHKTRIQKHYLPVSKARRDVANLTERKNPQTPVKEFVSLSVCPVR